MIIQRIFQSMSRTFQPIDIPEAAACPNCWGVQEWCDKYTSLGVVEEREGSFIKKFVDTYLPGVTA